MRELSWRSFGQGIARVTVFNVIGLELRFEHLNARAVRDVQSNYEPQNPLPRTKVEERPLFGFDVRWFASFIVSDCLQMSGNRGPHVRKRRLR